MSDDPAKVVEHFLALQPRLQRVLDGHLPSQLRRELASVTGRQLDAIGHLPEGGRSMREFAEALGIRAAAATTLADRLIAQGLAERRQDPNDRRAVRLVPTERALEVHARYQAWRRQTIGPLLERLGPEQLAALVGILGAVSEGAEPATPAAPGGGPATLPSAGGRERPDRPDLGAIAERWLSARAVLERRIARAHPSRLRRQLEGLSVIELDVIVHWPPGGSTAAELEESLGLTEAEARTLATRLVRRGYLRRHGAGGGLMLAERGELLTETLRTVQSDVLVGLLTSSASIDLHQCIFDVSEALIGEDGDAGPTPEEPALGVPA
ncbi:MAG TPA: MarR family transcriptional regulator [Candidatus Micrarchaeia archaeon]|nr:MarR family transcriptional regulator [Candidatus Micrarchaeia archaeon]